MSYKFRLVVTGSRSWSNRYTVEHHLDSLLKREDGNLLVRVGDCSGVDQITREWCADSGVELDVFPADWHAYGKAAGPIRNREMLRAGADLVLAFWDGKVARSGTLSCMKMATGMGVPVQVVGQVDPNGSEVLEWMRSFVR